MLVTMLVAYVSPWKEDVRDAGDIASDGASGGWRRVRYREADTPCRRTSGSPRGSALVKRSFDGW